MTRTPDEAAERLADRDNLLAEAIRLLLIVRNDYNTAYSYGLDWVKHVEELIQKANQ